MLAGLLGRAPVWAREWFEEVMRGAELEPGGLGPGWSVALGLVLGAAGLLGVALELRRRRAWRRLQITAGIEEIPGWLKLLGAVAGLCVLAGWLAPGLAGAARAVDASRAGLSDLWIAWGRRTALSVVVLGAVLGVIEHLASAHRLWQGLHLSRWQARERGSERRR